MKEWGHGKEGMEEQEGALLYVWPSGRAQKAPLALALRRRRVGRTRQCFLLAFDFPCCHMERQEDLRAKPFLYFMNRTKNESMTRGPEAELLNYLVSKLMADRYLFCSRSGQKTELRTFFFLLLLFKCRHVITPVYLTAGDTWTGQLV